MIRRSFADVGAGQVHVRRAGPDDGRLLVMIHPSPGSSRQLLGLMGELAARATASWRPTPPAMATATRWHCPRRASPIWPPLPWPRWMRWG